MAEHPSVLPPSRDYIFLGCARGNHDWQCLGGCNAGCGEWCGCSVPVHECAKCGDCDYGQNAEADETRQRCAEGRSDGW